MTASQFDLVYNCLSFTFASMVASTVFFFLRLGSIKEQYKSAMTITGLVTFIAAYHYLRIFNSWVEAYNFPPIGPGGKVLDPVMSGVPFNDAYRYMDWLLTVPLLLMEIVLVMQMPAAEATQKCWQLGVASALMIILGSPGEVSDSHATRWIFWALAMIPFIFIVYTLVIGLSKVADRDERPDVALLCKQACWWTVVSWCTYPIVYILPMLMNTTNGEMSAANLIGIQIGYSFSGVISKCGVGLMVYNIGIRKSYHEYGAGPLAEKDENPLSGV